jgi:hypothetical protein
MSAMYEAKLDRLDTWVVKNSDRVALGIIVVAFALRLFYAHYCYLNPDEAMHFGAARPTSWAGAYEASRRLVHPPLFTLVLHGILFVGRTELLLRLPSLIGGTLALWFTFAWLRRTFGAILALGGLLFMAFSPAAVSASTEVRQYGLLLCFICFSLYAIERTFSDRSIFWAGVQGVCLVAALLTSYTAIIALVSICFYVLLRSLLEGLPRRILFAIVVFDLVLAASFGWLYFGHIRQPHGPFSMNSLDYLRPAYYLRGMESPLGFVWRMLSLTFVHMASRRLGFATMAASVAGLVAIAKGRTKAPRLTAILLISPFVLGLLAGILRVFPFAGTRHQAYLLPFVAAVISASLAWVNDRVAAVLLVAAVIGAPLWAARARPDNDTRILPRGDMTAAIEYLHRMVPPGGPLFVDLETRETLEYYLARDDTNLDVSHKDFKEWWLGGYRVVLIPVWAFQPDGLLEQVKEFARAQGLPPNDSAWIVSTGWSLPWLSSRLPPKSDLDAKGFGRISVIKVNLDIAQSKRSTDQ